MTMNGRWMRAITCIAILTLAFPTATAQTDTIEITFDPSLLDLAPGGTGEVLVRLANRGITAANLSVAVSDIAGGMSVSLNASSVELAAGQTKTLRAQVHAPNAGNWSARFNANDGSAVAPTRGQATLLVRVATTHTNETSPPPPGGPLPITDGRRGANESISPSENETTSPPSNETKTQTSNGTNSSSPSPPTEAPAEEEPADNATTSPATPPPAPLRADVTTLTLASTDGDAVPFQVTVHNPAAAAQTAYIALRLPLGWGGTLRQMTIDIPAGANATLTGDVVPTREARDGEGALDITSDTAAFRVRLFLHAPALVDTGSSTTAPPEADAPGPSDAPGETDDTNAPASPATPLVRVEPSDIGAPPGANVLVTLIIENPGAVPLEGRARLDLPPLTVTPESASFRVEPFSSALVSFTLHVSDDLATGTAYDGAVLVELPSGQTPAPLRVRVTGASAAAPAPATADPPETFVVAILTLAGAGTIATIGAAAWRRWPSLGLFALYARLAPSRALEHPRRARMLETLRAQPGLTLAELQRTVGLTNGVARHHIHLLEAAGAVRSVQDGALRRLFPMDAPRVGATPPLADRALALLVDRGPMRPADMAVELGVTRQALHYHVKRLEADGRIRARRERAEVILMLRDA